MHSVYDAVIIGAGCAGMTCAMYLAAAGKSAVIIERESVGGQIAQTPRIDNFPAARGISGMEFSERLYKTVEEMGVGLELDEVTGITDGDIKTVTAEYDSYKAKTVVIAAGVKPRRLGIEDEERLIGRGVSYCAMCDGAFYKGGDVCVIGGGNTAFTDALYLAGICGSVHLIHRSDKFRAQLPLIEQVKSLSNVIIHPYTEAVKLLGADALEGITVKNTQTGAEKTIPLTAAFIAVGHTASNDIYKDIVKLSPDGFIEAGEDCKTSADGIFAAGDCRTKTVRQLVTASADGAVAADAIIKYISKK